MTHTPGPWKTQANYTDAQKGKWQIVTWEDQQTKIATIHGTKPIEETQANARLIASAPELLDACRDVTAILENWMSLIAARDNPTNTEKAIAYNSGLLLTHVNSAIARAEGRP